MKDITNNCLPDQRLCHGDCINPSSIQVLFQDGTKIIANLIKPESA